MSEQEKIDQSLRQLMKSTPPPALSSTFDAELASQLRPRRLDSVGRVIMILYAVACLVFFVWVMRVESLGWTLIAATIFGSLIVGAVARRCLS